jgi:xylulokinase
MHLIGLDIGTTGCKAALFHDDGTLIASASREYTVDIPHPQWAEQDAERVWSLAQDALRQVIAQAGTHDVAALGLSVQGEAVTPVDEQGRALRPMMLGMDTRTDAQNARLREQFGAEWLFEHTGMPVHTINTLPKLLWLKEHEPDLWKQAAGFRLYEDYLIHHMTGQVAISECLASRTQVYDLRGGRWSARLLDALALDPSRLAPVHPSGTVIAAMRKDLAESLGFAHPPLIVTGGHDQACGALGVGLTRPGLASVSSGTAEVMEVSLAEPALNETLYRANISVYAHVVPGLYVAMTLNHSGGLMLRWFRDTLCQTEIAQAQRSGADPYDLILKEAAPEPSPLLILPHFAGSGTPTFDTASKGAILGLTFATTKTDLAKAILEGLTFELRVNFDLLRAGGVEIDELRAIGGGARSPLWVQLKADVLGVPVAVPRVTDAACWGAALLAGVGAGCYADLAQAAESALRFDQHYVPEAARRALYEPRYALYRDVYPAVSPLNYRL